MKFVPVLATALASALLAAPAFATDLNTRLSELAQEELAGWLASDSLISALNAQNSEHASLSQDDIDTMDQTWRGEIGAGNAPLINGILNREASGYLRQRKDEADGLITEVFLMDNRGLNVAQSDLTSDYWQGDEAKFQETYGVGPGAIHISEVELDESTGTYQSQVSMVVTDPDSGAAIGAITFGVNVEFLN